MNLTQLHEAARAQHEATARLTILALRARAESDNEVESNEAAATASREAIAAQRGQGGWDGLLDQLEAELQRAHDAPDADPDRPDEAGAIANLRAAAIHKFFALLHE